MTNKKGPNIIIMRAGIWDDIVYQKTIKFTTYAS